MSCGLFLLRRVKGRACRFVASTMFRVGLPLAAALLCLATPAAAQGFFESLFGLSAPSPSAMRASIPVTPGGRPYVLPSGPITPRATPLDDIEFDTGTRYRTLCVRSCDGYMFPISARTTRRGFYRDQMRCRATCGDEARLFLVPAGALDTSDAVDIHGRPYASLRTANLYKKSYVSGCQCRPAPWSASEQRRHLSYADAEEPERAKLHAEAIAQVVRDAGGNVVVVEPVDAEPDPGRFLRAAHEDPAVVDAALEAVVPTPIAAARPQPALQRSAPGPRVVDRGPKPVRIVVQPLAKAPPAPKPPGLFGGPFAVGAASGLTWPGDAPRRN